MSKPHIIPAADPASVLIERQTRLLADLAETGMQAVRGLRIEDHTSVEDVVKISLDLDRIGKAIRQIVVLETDIANGGLADRLRSRADRLAAAPRPEPLLVDLHEAEEDLTVEGRCFGEMVQALCQALDVPVPHERLHAEDWVVDAPVVGAPAPPPPQAAWPRPRAQRSIMPASRPPSGRPPG